MKSNLLKQPYMKHLLTLLLSIAVTAVSAQQHELSVLWEELTAPDFARAVEQADGVCILPLGVVEKHGAHLPIGTDVYQARHIGTLAAEKEYSIVFPYFYAGVISEAKHQPGTLAYSPELLYKLLDETCAEIARNGIKKIIIYNIHGGNPEFLHYFGRTRLSEKRDYALYVVQPKFDEAASKEIAARRKSAFDSHGGELETSQMLVIRPDLVQMDVARAEPGDDLARIKTPGMVTAIQWYARFPNHYAGDAGDANADFGRFLLDYKVDELVEAVRAVKADDNTLEMYRRFYEEAEKPLETPVVR